MRFLSLKSVLSVSLVLLGTIILSSQLNATSNSESKESDKPRVGLMRGSPALCLTTESAVDDVQKARLEIEKKRNELNQFEEELKKREQLITEELKKLGEFRASIERLEQGQLKEKQDKVSKLVETVVAMPPRSSAKLLASLEDELAISVMSQLEADRLAKVMGLMDVKRSSQLSELMAGVKTKTEPGSQVSQVKEDRLKK